MAKKNRHKVKVSRGKAKPAAKKKAAPKRKTPKAPRAKQPRLAGVEDLPKDRVLDAACQEIHDGLVDINEGTAAVGQGKVKALARMESTGRHSYIAHGVRLMFTPGGAKVSAKLVDSDEGGEDDGGDGDEAEAKPKRTRKPKDVQADVEETPASERGIGGGEPFNPAEDK